MFSRKVKIACLVLAFAGIQMTMLVLTPRGCNADGLTPLAAAQRGISRINALISANKLSPDWANGFSQVTVSRRNVKGFPEYVLEFSSAKGSPGTITLFFNLNGGYTGSSLGE